jgi:hypothetical protein
MRNRSCQGHQLASRVPQMALAFPTKGLFDADERSEVVALLSRLLLQVARERSEKKVGDDAS